MPALVNLSIEHCSVNLGYGLLGQLGHELLGPCGHVLYGHFAHLGHFCILGKMVKNTGMLSGNTDLEVPVCSFVSLTKLYIYSHIYISDRVHI